MGAIKDWWKRGQMQRAERGWYRYDGLFGFEPEDFPKGYVEYPDGFRSRDMALGNAVDYARIFNDHVVQL